jgi:hypothetical protein
MFGRGISCASPSQSSNNREIYQGIRRRRRRKTEREKKKTNYNINTTYLPPLF